jgi:hypothetical protein
LCEDIHSQQSGVMQTKAPADGRVIAQCSLTTASEPERLSTENWRNSDQDDRVD